MTLLEDPREDELLYSVLARTLSGLVRVPAGVFKEVVFGSSNVSSTPLFPTRLERLIANTRPWGRLTADDLIEQNTLFRAFAAFWTAEQQETMRRYMCASSPSASPPAGLGRFAARQKRMLYCCLQCVEEDRRRHGEAHFRRAHQIPSVWWCPWHNVPLEQIPLNSNPNISVKWTYITLEEALKGRPLSSWAARVDTRVGTLIANLVRDSVWLLNYRGATPDEGWLGERMRSFLNARDYVTRNTTLRTDTLIDDLQDFLTPQLLVSLGCAVDRDNRWNWVNRIARRGGGTLHPTQYLLLMNFLGVSPAEFFGDAPVETEFTLQYGQGPWPCLNAVAEHYQRKVIVQTPHETAAGSGYVFHCNLCGYQYYLRKGSNWTDAKARTFGAIWEAELRKLAADPAVTKKAALTRLGVSMAGLGRACKQFGVGRWMLPRHKNGAIDRKSSQRSFAREKRIARGRSQVFEAMKMHPEWSRSDICECMEADFKWMVKHDQVWMESNLPERRTSNRPKEVREISRTQLDSMLAQEVREVAETFRSQGLNAKRISEFAIISRLSHRIYYNLRKNFPLTLEEISKEVESDLDYYGRKMRYKATKFISNGIALTARLLLRDVPEQHRSSEMVELANHILKEMGVP